MESSSRQPAGQVVYLFNCNTCASPFWDCCGTCLCRDYQCHPDCPGEDDDDDDFQSKAHEGPCCGSCDYEWAFTDIGMRNFGFGCCCKDDMLRDEER